jgi:endonuclease-8
VAEGDTIHRLARRLETALGGREIDRAEAPDPRSPVHRRSGELEGRRMESVDARGKHLLIDFSDGLAVHSHLGINGSIRIGGDGHVPRGRPWLLLASGDRYAAQFGGKLLRIVTESRLRNDPALMQLGPDPLRPEFDLPDAAARLRRMGAGRQVGEALLDQTIVAGIGNVIRIEACFRTRVDPWRKVDELSAEEAERVLFESRRVMQATLETGRRPSTIYGKARRPCPRCGERIQARGQGDANRIAYWCPGCQA